MSGTLSIRNVKEKFGIPPTTFLRFAKRMGVPIRASGCPGRFGTAHPSWKGGMRVDRDGYLRRYDPFHPWPRRGGYIPEHVRVMELHMGRRIAPGEVVHHMDHNKANNAIENLQLMPAGEHARKHRQIDDALRSRDDFGRYA